MDPNQIIVTMHAIQKYMDVTGCNSEERAANQIRKMLRKAKEVNLNETERAVRILNSRTFQKHGRIGESRHFEYNQYRITIIGKCVVTFEEKWPHLRKGIR